MEAMARVARRMGARIRLREPVQEILFEGRRAVGVRTHAGEQRFDALVVNADFADVMTKLVPDALRRRWTDRKIRRKKFSCSTFMLYLGLEGRLDEVAHHTIFIARDYAGTSRRSRSGAPVSAPSFYVAERLRHRRHTRAARVLHTLYMLIPVSTCSATTSTGRERQAAFRRVALDHCKAIGIEDVERRIVFEKIVTPAGWRDDMASTTARPSTCPIRLGRCCTCGRGTASRISTASISSAAVRIPAAGLPVIFESARDHRAG